MISPRINIANLLICFKILLHKIKMFHLVRFLMYRNYISSGIIKLAFFFNNSTLGLWIIDSGGIVHICSSVKHFNSYHHINLIPVKNDHVSIAKYVGIVQFSHGLTICDVLFIIDFNFNLIYVPKLYLIMMNVWYRKLRSWRWLVWISSLRDCVI